MLIHGDAPIAVAELPEGVRTMLASIVNASEDAIISVSRDLKIISWNNAATKTYGFSEEQALGSGLDLFVPPEQLDRSINSCRAVLNGVPTVSFEQRTLRKDGRVMVSSVSLFPLKDVYGNVQGVAGIGRDITALKETERELVATREAALAASRAKSEFLSSMSHEIRTPMTAILGMAELLAEGELNEEQRRYIEILNNNGYALLDLINSILDLAKVESGRLTLEHVAFDLREVVQKSAQTLALRAHAKRLELIVSVASDIPFVVMGDPLRLRQVLINLIANAIKFTDQGEVVVSVDRNCVPDDPLCLKFSVRDTGIGIAKDKLPLLFAAFAQADSSTARKYGGSGLGLAIVRRLVNLLRGEVAIESELGKGSVFSFTTQFEPRPDAPAAARWPELAEVPILIVDNNRTEREVLRRMFSDRGASVTEVASYAAGLVAITQAASAGFRRVSYCSTIGSHSEGRARAGASHRSRIAVRSIDHPDDSLRQPGGRRFAAAIHEDRNLPGQADRHERTRQSGSPRDRERWVEQPSKSIGSSAASQACRPPSQLSTGRSRFCSPTIRATTGL